MTKGSILQENIKVPNTYVPNNRASKYKRQKLIELQKVHTSAIIVEGSNTPVSVIGRDNMQKISKDRDDLNSQCGLLDIYRILCPTILFLLKEHNSIYIKVTNSKTNLLLDVRIMVTSGEKVKVVTGRQIRDSFGILARFYFLTTACVHYDNSSRHALMLCALSCVHIMLQVS